MICFLSYRRTCFRTDRKLTSASRKIRVTERNRIRRDVDNKETKFESSKGRCSRRRGVPRCTGLASYRKQRSLANSGSIKRRSVERLRQRSRRTVDNASAPEQ